jgi:GNAT superfamily N-acetyltransferase
LGSGEGTTCAIGEEPMTAELAKPAPAYDPAQFVVRPLTADDTENYRALRQKIRSSGGGRYFSDSYEREDRLNTQQWREWCSEKRDHCIIGTFYRDRLVGIMMITAQGPKNSLACEWEATWLEPEYRKTGIARQAYERVHQWTRAHGYEHALAFIREDNARSREIREEQGFIYTRTKHGEVWADGSVADTNLFILDLSPKHAANGNPHDAICRLEATLASMKGEIPLIEEAMRDRITSLRAEPHARATSHLEGTLASLGQDDSTVADEASRPADQQIRESSKVRHG